MAVNLQKGQRVDLTKSDGLALRQVMVGLGWDEVKKSGGLFGGFLGGSAHDIDCDATAFVCIEGKLRGIDDIVYYGNLKHKTGCVNHMGDNLIGEGEGDDEQIFVDLSRLPSQYDKIIFVVNIYKAKERSQHFGMIQNAFIRIVDDETHKELCRYNLSENYDGFTAMVFGEIYLRASQWRFNAIGQATKDNSIEELAKRFM